MTEPTTPMLTLIVDDEPIARRGLRRLLERESDIDIVGECSTGREAVDMLSAQPVDLVFMDVQMPEMNGFEALGALDAEELPIVIFVTAYDQYALRAFDAHAVDYLLKPFTNRRLQDALDRARRLHRSDRRAEDVAELRDQLDALLDRVDARSPNGAPEHYLQRLPIRKRHQVLFVDVEDVDWIEAADNYVEIHAGDDTHLLRATLTEMEEQLDPDQFLRIHRSTIVNVERIRELHPRGSGDCEIVLDDGTSLRSSRTYSDRRRDVLNLAGSS